MRLKLDMVQATLEYVQPELAANLAERSGAPGEDAGPPAPVGEPAMTPVPAADTVTAKSAAALVTATDAEPASRGGHDIAAKPAPDRRSWRAVSLWALWLTATVGIVIGRATVTRDEADADHDAMAMRTSPTSDAADERREPAGDAADERSEPAGDAAVCDEPPPIAVDDAPPAPPPPGPKPDGPQPPPRGAVTTTEAEKAAQRALPSLRDCTEAPPSVTADLEIVRGRGVVTALNLHAPAPDDPRYRWHACAKRSLEGVRFPVSEAAGHVQVRLKLR